MQTQEQKRLYNQQRYQRRRKEMIDAAVHYARIHPEKVVYARRTRQLKRDHGMTRAQYQEMYGVQGGVCYICGQQETHRSFKNLSVDHNHVTGVWRKLLCHQCNVMIGMARESIMILQAAILYLQEHKGIINGPPTTNLGSQPASTVG